MSVYVVYNKDTDKIVNVIEYDGIAKYDETVFHGEKAQKVLLGKTDAGGNVSIGDKYEDGKFIKVEKEIP